MNTSNLQTPPCCQPPPPQQANSNYYYDDRQRCNGGTLIGPYPSNIGPGASFTQPMIAVDLPAQGGNPPQIGISYGMTATFKKPCGCCAYRQCVRGYTVYRRRGTRQWLPALESTPLLPFDYLEDTDANSQHYGHRSDGLTNPSNGYISECIYQMIDVPGIPNASSHSRYAYMFRYEFTGVIFDWHRQIALLSKGWVVQTKGAAALPGPGKHGGTRRAAAETSEQDADTSTGGSEMVETVLVAQIPTGEESLSAAVWQIGESDQGLNITYTHALRPTATPLSDIQVTLFLKDGSSVQPPPDDPDLKEMIGFRRGNSMSENVFYNLAGIDLTQVNAVQASLHGQSSGRIAFKNPRPVEQLAR